MVNDAQMAGDPDAGNNSDITLTLLASSAANCRVNESKAAMGTMHSVIHGWLMEVDWNCCVMTLFGTTSPFMYTPTAAVVDPPVEPISTTYVTKYVPVC